MQKIQFSDMELSNEMQRAVEEMGFEEPTSIQAASIPMILSGRDVIGHSQTGTGKTAAFSIPAIEKINPAGGRKTQVLILCPTRELAVQACDEIRKFAKYKPFLKVVPIYGGQPIERQFTALRGGAQIVVGTPGRVMDHMRRGTLKLDTLHMIILDEADAFFQGRKTAQEAARVGVAVLTTIHSNSCEATYRRMVSLCKRAVDMSDETLLSYVTEAYPIVVFCKQLENKQRRMMEIMECEILPNGDRRYNTLFRYVITENHMEDGKFVIEGHHTQVNEISVSLRKRLLENGMPNEELQAILETKKEANAT